MPDPTKPDATKPDTPKSAAHNSSPALIALAWIVVGVPLGWGVYKSALNAVKLFQSPPLAATASPSPSTAPAPSK